jgi:hypothetical protein
MEQKRGQRQEIGAIDEACGGIIDWFPCICNGKIKLMCYISNEEDMLNCPYCGTLYKIKSTSELSFKLVKA